MSNSLGQYQEVISRRLAGVGFSYYTSDEIRKLSVKEITHPIAFDSLNRPIKGGLYDPCMGISPYDKFTRCETCGCEGLECPGHLGHVELLLPVYNPFMIDRLLKLLRAQCLKCHQFRMTKSKSKMFAVMFTLIKLGYIFEAQEYKSICESLNMIAVQQAAAESTAAAAAAATKEPVTPSRRKSSDKSSDTEMMIGKSENTEASRSAGQKKLRGDQRSLEEKKKALHNLMNIKDNADFLKGVTYTHAMNKTFEETLKEFWSSINVGKCPHCKAQQQAIRKEGFSKFFIKKSSSNGGGSSKKGSTATSSSAGSQQNKKQTDYDSSDEEKSTAASGLDKTMINQKYMDPMEIKECMRKFWETERKLLNIIFGTIEANSFTLKNSAKGFMIRRNDYNMFFMEVIPVTPNRFRPENKLGEQTFLHGHTVVLTKILQFNAELRRMIVLQRGGLSEEKKRQLLEQLDSRFSNQLALKQNPNFQQNINSLVKLNDVITKWLDIQEAVNCFLDSTKATKMTDREGTGIRQLLEKKEGLFRMKMMGKRVNYAARSVISPDPNLNTNEVGVPLFVAKKLTFPEYVNEYNAKHLRQLIINGPFHHPGANFLVENGNKISLEALNEQQRVALAKTLLTNAKNKVVYRHLQSGDVLLFNRQPTLHKASLMSHIARVLPREQTIRMHYANCKSYNADFDGDEMNLHFMQSHLARAEGYYISLNDRQFINTTNGNPLRELIQDSIISAVFLTHKEKFLEKEVFQELIYAATWNMFEHPNTTTKPYKLFLVPPAIQKPRPLWTGKQLITNIVKIVVQQNQKKDYEQGVFMDLKAKLTAEELTGIYKDDTVVIVRDNELLQGVLDKNQFGAGATYGLMHAFFELYGSSLTGKLFTALAKLLSAHLQMHGFTCGLDDLLVHKDAEAVRLQEIKQAHVEGVKTGAEFAGIKDYEVPETWQLYNRPDFQRGSNGKKFATNVLKRKPGVDYLAHDNSILTTLQTKLTQDPILAEAQDNMYKSTMAQQGSKILATSLTGLIKKFPFNNFATMTNSGAKGSKVNHTQVSALLGQQELEGRRVPVMATGKTLPCFLPYDPNPRAGGFISDRFLSGLRPAEFFFHCMAGREGLIDTAVKTSRSGYLQRCLMKHLEVLKVAYDYTVRDADGSVVQFFYGEDGIDPNKVKYLEKYRFLSENFSSFAQKYDPYHLKESHDFESVQKFLKKRKRATPEVKEQTHDTIMNNFLPGKYIGSVSEKVHRSLKDYIKKEESSDKFSNIFEAKKEQLNPSKFRVLFNVKYLNSLIHPGDAVGCLAAQSIGEPSTQMTLNTFHLAGHGGVNLTLGIPRLREILMTATDKLKTPMMLLSLTQSEVSQNKELAQNHARKLQKINLFELVNFIEVKEQKIIVKDNQILPFNERFRHYQIDINLEDLDAIDFAFQLNIDAIAKRVEKIFLPNLFQYITKELKRDLKTEMQTRIFRKKEEGENAASGIDTEGLASDYDKSDAVSDGEELKSSGNNSNFASEVEYSIFTETEDETSKQVGVAAATKPKPLTAEKKIQRAKNELQSISPYYNGHSIEGEVIRCHIKLPLDSKKLLMANMVQKILQKTLVYEVKNISNATVLKKDGKGGAAPTYQIQTEGVNFKAIWKMDQFDSNTIDSNDIAALNKCYGIEAARNAIVKEIVTVFGVYGVVVDYRHLYLIADYLTFSGEMKAMNRVWMDESISPFLKMSFETCVKFLTNAATNNEIDTLATPSSQIVLGRVPQVGTGCFDILHKI